MARQVGKSGNSLLSDLGKPTKRGVRKCPQCGILNGSRGISCKNRDVCNYIFKEPVQSNRKQNVDACKLITEASDVDIYSVKCRDRGLQKVRGFVKVQILACDSNADQSVGNVITTTIVAMCLVNGCKHYEKSNRISLIGDFNQLTFSEDCGGCIHVISSIKTGREAEPFPIKHSVLNAMSISPDWKQDIWLKARTDGPLVQRVSSCAMAVKCDNDIGYLHVYFFMPEKLSSFGSDFPQFGCSCNNLSNSQSPRKKFSCGGKMFPSNSVNALRCIHFYSCLAVFAGDAKLQSEFSSFIQDDKLLTRQEIQNGIRTGLQAEKLALSSDSVSGNEAMSLQLAMEEPDGTIRTISLPSGSLRLISDQSFLQVPETVDKLESVVESAQPLPNIESPATVSAFEWLAGVTERINETMHYGFRGKPSPLKFHVPHHFFAFLRDRISCGHTKKRLPDLTTTIVRKVAPPLGEFTKYTWQIFNVFQLKQIFDTPSLALDVTRRFILNKDDTYSFVQSWKPAINGSRRVKPDEEFKTFLKVGQITPDPNNSTPFIIEWIPDLYPRSKHGEMQIIFQYGHQKNGLLDQDIVW